MIYISSLIGVFIYATYVWLNWSNKFDKGLTDMSLSERFRLERQELVITIIGALLFMWQGDGILESTCDIAGYIFSESTNELCKSLKGNTIELMYVIGGASFGSTGIFLVKLGKKKAEDKLR